MYKKTSKNNRSVAFYTLGCKVNQYETNSMTQKFVKNGYEIVESDDVADIYVINTCTVTNIADRKSRQYLRRAKEKNKDALVIAVRMLCTSGKKCIRTNARSRLNSWE